nr:uncharacterized protein LOC129449187 [Misgurnus anguillicaudatus]
MGRTGGTGMTRSSQVRTQDRQLDLHSRHTRRLSQVGGSQLWGLQVPVLRQVALGFGAYRYMLSGKWLFAWAYKVCIHRHVALSFGAYRYGFSGFIQRRIETTDTANSQGKRRSHIETTFSQSNCYSARPPILPTVGPLTHCFTTQRNCWYSILKRFTQPQPAGRYPRDTCSSHSSSGTRSPHKGMSEAEGTHVFSSSGENVTLSCINALSDCTSTTWTYNKHRSSAAVELIIGGIKNKNRERDERLSLGSDCSLNIYKTTKDDHGQYTCQQYVNGQTHGTDAQIFLHVLHVSSSSTQTEMRSGSSVTLTCQLFTYDNTCDGLVLIEGLQLFWVNQAGVNLQTDSRYQILSGPCIITLTTTLLNEDNNTEWRCLVQMKNETKISVRYTVKFKGPTKTDAVPAVTTINTERLSTLNSPVTPIQHSQALTTTTTTTLIQAVSVCKKTSSPTAPSALKQQVPVIAAVIAAVFLFVVVLLGVICIKKRSGSFC